MQKKCNVQVWLLSLSTKADRWMDGQINERWAKIVLISTAESFACSSFFTLTLTLLASLIYPALFPSQLIATKQKRP